MTGAEVKKILTNSGYILKEIADRMNETPQSFHSFLNSRDIKTGILERIALAIDKDVLFFYEKRGKETHALKKEKLLPLTAEKQVFTDRNEEIEYIKSEIARLEVRLRELLSQSLSPSSLAADMEQREYKIEKKKSK